MDVSILDRYFTENPGRREAYLALIPELKDDECWCVKKTATGITPRKSIYVDGVRHILSVRSIITYLVRGEYATWVPFATCQPGCIHPHHQLAMVKGVHDLQSNLTADHRAANSMADTLGVPRPTFKDMGVHEPLPLPASGVDHTNRDEHAAKSLAHTLGQTYTPSEILETRSPAVRNDRSMAAE